MGKTLSAIIMAVISNHMTPGSASLIVVPVGLFDQWTKQIYDWLGYLDNRPEIVTVKTGSIGNFDVNTRMRLSNAIVLVKDSSIGRKDQVSNTPYAFSTVIVDEAHTMRNGNVSAKNICKLADAAHFRLFMSATPFVNRRRDADIFYPFLGVSPQTSWADVMYTHVMRRAPVATSHGHTTTVRQVQMTSLERRLYDYVESSSSMTTSERRLSLHMLKRLLPSSPRAFMRHLESQRLKKLTGVPADQGQWLQAKGFDLQGLGADEVRVLFWHVYARAHQGVFLSGFEAEALPITSDKAALVEACRGHILARPGSKEMQVLEQIHTWAAEDSSTILVFAEFVAEADMLAHDLKRLLPAVEVVVYHGQLQQVQKSSRLERALRGEVGVLIMTLATGSTGHNLQGLGWRIIFITLGYVPSATLQGIGRMARSGQEHHVQVVRFVTSDCEDERVLAIQLDKQRLMADALGLANLDDVLLGDVSEVPVVQRALAARDSEKLVDDEAVEDDAC